MPHTMPNLWFTSSTPARLGQTTCNFARWMGYHAGAHGTGWRRVGLSVPLATGSAVHTAIEHLGGWMLEYQQKNHGRPPQDLVAKFPDVIAWAATEAAESYAKLARKRGFAQPGLTELPAAVETLIQEQSTLIEGLVWVMAIAWLPNVLTSYRVLDVEREEALVLDCTCGMDAVSDWRVHQSRGCAGIVQQGRADWLLEPLDPAKKLAYVEFKTKAMSHLPTEQAYNHSGQLLTNMEAASRRLGKPVDEAFVPFLYKGRFMTDRGDPPGAPKTQHSPLCYGYYDAGSPGFRDPAWSSQYKWFDDYGKGHTVGKTFTQVPLWDLNNPIPAVRSGATRVESWVRGQIADAQWPSLMKVLGPIPRPVNRVPLALEGIRTLERRWRDDVAYLREHQAVTPGNPLVDQVIDRAWNCISFDGVPCEFKKVCDRDPGWENPDTMGGYQWRTPHHESEYAAVVMADPTLKDQLVQESEDEEGGTDGE